MTLHIEPVGGVAGDMLLGALIDLGADVAAVRQALLSLRQPGLRLELSRVEVNGIAACKVTSLPSRPEHAHHRLGDVLGVVDRGDLSTEARAMAHKIFGIVAKAEAVVHGENESNVRLHEVGASDSILDVVGIAVALDNLGDLGPISCAPLPSGGGYVQTQHGRLACPVPAVQEISSQWHVPLLPVSVRGETVTPTGIAVVAAIDPQFEARPAPTNAEEGVGAGSRRFPDRPNVVRLYRH